MDETTLDQRLEDLVNSRFDKLELKIVQRLAQHYRLPLDNNQRSDNSFFNQVRNTANKRSQSKDPFERVSSQEKLLKRHSTIEKNQINLLDAFHQRRFQ